MILAHSISNAIEKLKKANIDNPQLDARLLVGHALGMDRAKLLSYAKQSLTEHEMTLIDDLLERRLTREPVARIIGAREFWGLLFGLNEATLDPRPDSETLIEAVLKYRKKKARVLDLGTGSGCLLLSLLYEMRDATGLGIDIASRAIEQAQKNAVSLSLNERAHFRTGDWLKDVNETFDIIISNPPYIRKSDIGTLAIEVRDFDPPLALDGGDDGLDPYRLFIPQMKKHLKPSALVAFELGQGQANDVENLLRQEGYMNVQKHKDLGGIERCVTAEMPTYPDN